MRRILVPAGVAILAAAIAWASPETDPSNHCPHAAASASHAADPADEAWAQIHGDYLEVRTADVWTGPCFANGEVNLTGQEAVLAWHVRGGQWAGVSLDDLRIVAVIRANATLGDPFARSLVAKSMLVVDNRATNEQSEALVGFARAMGGELLDQVVSVKRAPIEMSVLRESGQASVTAGDFAELKTRALSHRDAHCGNESRYYPPLTEVADAYPAFTLAHRFSGEGLGSTWSVPSKRSAYIGTFAR